jgi:predicted nucleic acid-binding Zn ribbon protein
MAEKRARMKRPAPVADLMTAIFRGKPAEKRLEEGKIWLVWDTVVGEQIAAKARPVCFRDGVLTVAVANSPWMQQLTFLKKGILEKLNERLGRELVRDIYLKAGTPEPSKPLPKPHRNKERLLAGEEKTRIAEQSAAIADPELREAVAHLLTRHLANTKQSD